MTATTEARGRWIYSDADNTLWDTDKVFADAQLSLLDSIEELVGTRFPGDDRLAFLRRYDQAIASIHHSRLRYPPALLVRGLQMGLKGITPDVVAARVVASGALASPEEDEVVRRFHEGLQQIPPLLPTVREGIEHAQRHQIGLFVITEGPQEKAAKTAQANSVLHQLSGILSATKTVELYRRLAQRSSLPVSVMIGDQADRDIGLAHRAGMKAVLVQSRFRPKWVSQEDVALADSVTEDFARAVEAAIKWIE